MPKNKGVDVLNFGRKSAVGVSTLYMESVTDVPKFQKYLFNIRSILADKCLEAFLNCL